MISGLKSVYVFETGHLRPFGKIEKKLVKEKATYAPRSCGYLSALVTLKCLYATQPPPPPPKTYPQKIAFRKAIALLRLITAIAEIFATAIGPFLSIPILTYTSIPFIRTKLKYTQG